LKKECSSKSYLSQRHNSVDNNLDAEVPRQLEKNSTFKSWNG
jgi:hypothetical protein